jgi:NADPH:quinone reductase
MMGDMGRTLDGGYAEYTCVPASHVIPFTSDLEWSILGAMPEMLQTAHGSLTVGLDAQSGQSILIRGGTSSVGMAAAVLANQRDMTGLSTTRSTNKTATLTDLGVDHVLIDDGNVASQVRETSQPGSTLLSNLSGRLPCRTRCTRLGSTESCASPGCCPMSGQCATSTRLTTSPRSTPDVLPRRGRGPAPARSAGIPRRRRRLPRRRTD